MRGQAFGVYLRLQKIFWRLSGTQSTGYLFEESGVVAFTAAVQLKDGKSEDQRGCLKRERKRKGWTVPPHNVPWCEIHREPWWQRLCWEILRHPRPWCTPNRRSWSALWRSEGEKWWRKKKNNPPKKRESWMETITVTYCVPVHETPDRCSHLTGKEDHQKEEKLQKAKF